MEEISIGSIHVSRHQEEEKKRRMTWRWKEAAKST
jgi:hypothetical protein